MTRGEPREQIIVKLGPHQVHFDSIHDLAGKSINEKAAGRGLVDTPRAQVKERIGIQLADGGSMGTLDVVGIDLQLRLCTDLRLVRKQKVVVGLLGVCLLSTREHHDSAVKDPAGLLPQNPFINLPAVAVGFGMFESSVVVDVLTAGNQIETVQ